MKRFIKRLGRNRSVQRAFGHLLALYLRLVWKTARFDFEPPDLADTLRANQPIIAAMWHGQHFMIPLAAPVGLDFHALVSRSRDGEINATICHDLGVKTVRASGGRNTDIARKGGVQGFLSLLKILKRGASVAMTVNVPKEHARRCGPGVVRLAARSGRPVVPVAFASSRRRDLNSWDRASINLPFSRCVLVGGAPVFVAADADDHALETARQRIERHLQEVTERARTIVDNRG